MGGMYPLLSLIGGGSTQETSTRELLTRMTMSVGQSPSHRWAAGLFFSGVGGHPSGRGIYVFAI